MESPTLNPGSPRSIASAVELTPVSWMTLWCLPSLPQAGGDAPEGEQEREDAQRKVLPRLAPPFSY
jgi:hypothetical protein